MSCSNIPIDHTMIGDRHLKLVWSDGPRPSPPLAREECHPAAEKTLSSLMLGFSLFGTAMYATPETLEMHEQILAPEQPPESGWPRFWLRLRRRLSKTEQPLSADVAVMSDRSMRSGKLLRPKKAYEGCQGLRHLEGVALQSAGSRNLSLHLLHLDVGARGKPHRRDGHESALYVVSGALRIWYGESLHQCVEVRDGDMFYIPPGLPLLQVNASPQPAVAVIAHTDPDEQGSVILLPELDQLVRP
jgi:uncharacterized RmlC-like cupin family protein